MPTTPKQVFATAIMAYGAYVTGFTQNEYTSNLNAAYEMYADFAQLTEQELDAIMMSSLNESGVVDVSRLASSFYPTFAQLVAAKIQSGDFAVGSSTRVVPSSSVGFITFNNRTITFIDHELFSMLDYGTLYKSPMGLEKDGVVYMLEMSANRQYPQTYEEAKQLSRVFKQLITVDDTYGFQIETRTNYFYKYEDVGASTNVARVSAATLYSNGFPGRQGGNGGYGYNAPFLWHLSQAASEGWTWYTGHDVPFFLRIDPNSDASPLVATILNGVATLTEEGIEMNVQTGQNLVASSILAIDPRTASDPLVIPSGSFEPFTPSAEDIEYGYSKGNLVPTDQVRDGKILTIENMYPGLLRYDASFADVAKTGSYNDLSDKPTLATVATSGDYDDLENKPTLFSGDYEDLEGAPLYLKTATIPVEHHAHIYPSTYGVNPGQSTSGGVTRLTYTAYGISSSNPSYQVPASQMDLFKSDIENLLECFQDLGCPKVIDTSQIAYTTVATDIPAKIETESITCKVQCAYCSTVNKGITYVITDQPSGYNLVIELQAPEGITEFDLSADSTSPGYWKHWKLRVEIKETRSYFDLDTESQAIIETWDSDDTLQIWDNIINKPDIQGMIDEAIDDLADVATSGDYNDLINKPETVAEIIKTVNYTLSTYTIENQSSHTWSYNPVVPDGYTPVGIVGYDTGIEKCTFTSLHIVPNSNPPEIQVVAANFETAGRRDVTPNIYVLYVKSEYIS